MIEAIRCAAAYYSLRPCDGQRPRNRKPTTWIAVLYCLAVKVPDRLGRSLRHLVGIIDELAAVGVGFTSLGEGIDTTAPAATSTMCGTPSRHSGRTGTERR